MSYLPLYYGGHGKKLSSQEILTKAWHSNYCSAYLVPLAIAIGYVRYY